MLQNTRRKLSAIASAMVGFGILACAAATSIAQQGVAQKIGHDLDQGVQTVGSEVRQGWDKVREAGNRMGVNARVYARLHWDKALETATIDVDVRNGGVVVLRGSVADEEARTVAERLARDTVGVTKVVSELGIASAPTTK